VWQKRVENAILPECAEPKGELIEETQTKWILIKVPRSATRGTGSAENAVPPSPNCRSILTHHGLISFSARTVIGRKCKRGAEGLGARISCIPIKRPALPDVCVSWLRSYNRKGERSYGNHTKDMRWVYRVQMVLGIWIFVSPWVLGYANSSAALWNSIVGGALVALASLWGLFGEEEVESISTVHTEK